MSKPIIAIVGRPNVGKSSLFNKITGKRLSIVEDTPGVTRDRIYADAEWSGKSFTIIDTGGIEPEGKDVLLSQMREQASIAIDTADVIILITDVKTGVTSADRDIATLLRRASKPVVLCVNKVDAVGAVPSEFYEFYNLGLGEPVAVSSIHGTGTGDLLDAAFEHIDFSEFENEDEDIIRVALIGKPNVGKSSLTNCLLGENRMIVSDIPGTTRDAVDVQIENEHGRFCLIDTAGIRKKKKVDETIERYSVLRSFAAVDRADVCVIMLDANEGVTVQDTKIAGFANDKGKALVIAVNKWDIAQKETGTMERLKKDIYRDLSFMDFAPIVFISAKTGQRTDRLMALIYQAAQQNKRRVTTGMLNDFLSDATARVQPPSDKGKRLKIYYMTQASVCPPTFIFFVNRSDLFHFSYKRYLENRLREVFGFEGSPVRFIVRERGEDGKV
ncbi:MAG: ribosome biogenesis GTPase Der [Clostridia bacterium]|nr:ribosome biogenesis GTPase Der [Clostridia bacterium]